MGTESHTLGKAIDQVLAALEPLEPWARETALVAVCRQLKINAPTLQVGIEEPSPTGVNAPEVSTPAAPSRSGQVPTPQVVDIRTLKDQKNPASAKQMACVVAYYLQELAPTGERKDTVNTADLEKYFKQAGFKLPTKLAQILVDAKASGYFDSPARGEYKLNAVGYNLVAHNLPTRQS